MGVTKDTIQIEVEVNGLRKAGTSLADLDKEARDLKRSIRHMETGTEEYRKATERLRVVNTRIREIRNDMRGVSRGIADARAETSGFAKLWQSIGPQLSAAALGAIALQVAHDVAQITKEIRNTKRELSTLTGLEGAALDDATNRTRAIAATFEQDVTEITQAANAASKQLGISYDEALSRIEEGFVAGSNANGEFLASIQEYPTFFKEAGLGADAMFAALNRSAKEGIFSDKGVDAIKEVTLRLREMPKTTQDALNQIGLDSERIKDQIEKDGIGSAIATVSERLGELKADSPEVGTAIADIFGGAGEDAGLDYLLSLKDINSETGSLIDTTNVYQMEQQQLLEANQELAESQNELANSLGGTGATLDRVKIQFQAGLYRVLLLVVETFKEVYSAISPVIDQVVDLAKEFGLVSGEDSAFESILTLLGKGAALATVPLKLLGKVLENSLKSLTWLVRKGKEFLEFIGVLDEETAARTKKQAQEQQRRDEELLRQQQQTEQRRREQVAETTAQVEKEEKKRTTVIRKAVKTREQIRAEAAQKEAERRMQELARLKADLERENLIIEQRRITGELSAREYTDKLVETQEQYWRTRLGLYQTYGQQETAEAIKLQNQLLEVEQRRAERAAVQPLTTLEARPQQLLDFEGTDNEGRIANDEEVELAQLENRYLNLMIAEEEYEQLRYEAKEEALQRRLDLLTENGEAETTQFKTIQNELLRTQQEADAARLESRQRSEQNIQNIMKVGFAATQEIFTGLIGLLKSDEDARKKHAKTIKAFEKAKISVNAVTEISEIFKTFAALGPIGQVIAILKVAGVVLRSQNAIAQINSQKFASGGFTGRGYGVPDQTGYKPAGIVHEGEYVAPKWMVEHPQYAPVIASLEGVRRRGYADGGLVGVDTTPSLSAVPTPASSAQSIDLGSFERAVARFERTAENLRATVSLSEINQAQNTLDQSEATANF